MDPGDLTRSRDTDTGKTAAAAGLVPLQTSPGGAPAQEAGRKLSSSSSPLPTSVRRPGPCARTKSSVVSVGKLLPGAGWLSPASLFLSRSHPQISVPLATSLLHTPSPGNSHHTAGRATPLAQPLLFPTITKVANGPPTCSPSRSGADKRFLQTARRVLGSASHAGSSGTTPHCLLTWTMCKL